MKQLIIVRKDLEMTPGKMSAQVAHASMAFLSNWIRNYIDINYNIQTKFDKQIYDEWIQGVFTKIVLRAKNRNDLLKVVSVAEELGLNEGNDYFLIKDNCLTELEPEEVDENGVGRTLTCIGFKPMPDDICKILSKKYQLYQ